MAPFRISNSFSWDIHYTIENGTLQLVGYTSEKLFEQDKKQLEELLNGLTVINN
jgi:hypothetical protein